MFFFAAMRAGIKQIKLFIKAMQKRMKDSKKKQEEIIHLGLVSEFVLNNTYGG